MKFSGKVGNGPMIKFWWLLWHK